ncbi:MAG: hypothetical protein Q7Q71_06485 [Verrucomicrobiota bacterium JB023]|nr:hypothetical protein [Verrucomicrobiota bacterium JB023]
MKPIALFIALLIIALSAGLQAHQDKPLKLEKGKLTGLPGKYQPAAFDPKKKTLTIAGKSLAFPEILHPLFTDDHVDELFGELVPVKGHHYQLKFSASWYHEKLAPELPPYIMIRIEPQGRDYSFEFVIDMDRLIFIRADAKIALVGTVPIDLDGVVDSVKQIKSEQVGADQPATATESELEGVKGLKSESEGCCQ